MKRFLKRGRYSKPALLRDALRTLKNLRYPANGKLVAELTEVIFACLQTALLQRGTVTLPGIGEIRVEFHGASLQYLFLPSQDFLRRIQAATAEDS